MTRFVTIGSAARASGVPEWRLRAWETAGLLTPARSAAGYRMFDEPMIERARQLLAELTGGERLATMSLAHGNSLGLDPAVSRSAPDEETETSRSARELELLRFVTHELHSTDDTQRAAEIALAAVARFVGADAAVLTTSDRVRNKISVYCSYSLSPAFESQLERWKPGKGFGGQAYTLREPVAVPDLLAASRLGREMIVAEGLRAYVGVPIARGSQRVGLMECYRRTPDPFSPLDIDLLEFVAAAITPFIETRTLELQVQNLHNERARHFRTLVSQFSSTRNRQVERQNTRVLALAAELENQDHIKGPTAAARVHALVSRHGQAGETGFDLLELVQSGIVERFELEEGLSCSLSVGTWPATLSTAQASRLYLLLLRIAEELASVATKILGVYMDSTAEELWIEFTYDLGERQPDTQYSPGAEATEIIDELQGRVGTNQSADSYQVNLLIPRPTEGHLADLLTRRERQILETLGRGKCNRDVAVSLDISIKTLQNHLSAIYRKLQVSDRSEALTFLEQ